VAVGQLRARFAAGTRLIAVYAQLRRQGTPIPTNDMWIAALTSQHDLALCTRDRHFDRLPQIPRA
jgi:predicted nucleic acid-binding protein